MSGVRQLIEDAAREGLAIEATVADIRQYLPERSYDVVVTDRTLHMLRREDERSSVLAGLLLSTTEDSVVLITDERSNIAAFENVFDESRQTWSTILKRRGYLFVRRSR